jgi:hypothetical protein
MRARGRADASVWDECGSAEPDRGDTRTTFSMATPARNIIPSQTGWDRHRAIALAGFAAAALVFHLIFNRGYGYFRDELYYLACGQHLDWGYVDQPPLIAVIAWASRALLGDSLAAIRFFPAVAHAAKVVLAGLIARELGGKFWATLLACAATFSALVYLAGDNLLSMNAFDPLFWMGCAWIVARIANGGSPRLWLWFGVLAGLGLQNKHSMAFFGAAMGVGLLFTPMRRHFAEKWIWLGALLALLIALPNLIWEMRHGWATWELLSNVARSNKNVVLGPAEFVKQQVLIMNPATAPLWIGGLVWLLAARHGRHYRALGIAYLVALVEFIVLRGKHYYLAPAYPMLFAAGGVAAERLQSARVSWLKPVMLVTMVALAASLAPTATPILPPEKTIAYMKAIHFAPPRTERNQTAALPQVLADQFGWPEMVEQVARVYNSLPAAERAKAGIFGQDYGQAAAIDFFGPKYGLPPTLSGHQSYYLWGPRGYTGEVLVVLDARADDEREQFASVEDMGPVHISQYAMPWERRQHIYVCRGLKMPLAKLWPMLKVWL